VLAACDEDSPHTPAAASPALCERDLDCAAGDPCAPRACVAGACVASGAATACAGGTCDGEAQCVAPCVDSKIEDGRCGPPEVCPLALVPRLPWLPAAAGLPLRWSSEGTIPDEARPASLTPPPEVALEVALATDGAAEGAWQPLPPGRTTLGALAPLGADPRQAVLRLRLRTPPAGCEAVEFRHALTLLPADPAAVLAAVHAAAIIARDDPRIAAWARDWLAYAPGAGVDAAWRDPRRALGPSAADAFDVLPLGEGGSLAVPTPWALHDGEGPELAIFENANPADFVELAFVEVSSDGQHFARFDTLTLGTTPVHAYGTMDPSHLAGFAGPAPLGSGRAFDLADLRDHPAVRSGKVDLNGIRFVRVVDIPGDGRVRDSLGHPVYDPYPTWGSAGFDLDAIGFLAPPPR
jgi:hypothetical protein